jgi:hypothetical protein
LHRLAALGHLHLHLRRALAALHAAGMQLEGARRDNAVLQGIAVQLAEAIKRGTAENRGLVAALAAAEARVVQEGAAAVGALESSRAEAEAARAESRALKQERDAAAELDGRSNGRSRH